VQTSPVRIGDKVVFILGVCIFYLAVRFLTAVSTDIERIAYQNDQRLSQLEAQVLRLEQVCAKDL
jgi:hypothetical protein